MDILQKYLYGVISAALVCAVVITISPKNKVSGKLISMMCGIFLLLNIIKPIRSIDLSNIGNIADELRIDSSIYVSQGIESSSQALREVIKEECESYVMEKATQMGADISIDIRLDESEMPTPLEITVSGTFSPYTKERLSYIITQDLNIPKERQIWT